MEKKKLSLAVALLLASPLALSASDSNEELSQLQKRVAELEQKDQLADWITRFSVNGFASFGVGMAKDGAGYAGYGDDKVNFSEDSMFALQTNYFINDKTSATLQLVTRGQDDWDLEAEWAFVSYDFGTNTTARVGRLRAPMFMLSDYLEVGYAYPFARPSEEVYGFLPVYTYTGADLLHSIDFDSATLGFQPVVGEADVDADATPLNQAFELEELYGLASTLEFDELLFRASYFSANSVADGREGENDVTFIGGGFRYDNGSVMLMSEWTRVEVDGAYPDTDAYYAAATYRIGMFSPYVMYSVLESKDDNERDLSMFGERSFLDVERTTYSAGVRWDFTVGAALKFDVSYSTDFEGTTGGMYDTNTAIKDLPVVGPVGVVDEQFDDALVYTVVLDVAF